jgi:hypothetical protein
MSDALLFPYYVALVLLVRFIFLLQKVVHRLIGGEHLACRKDVRFQTFSKQNYNKDMWRHAQHTMGVIVIILYSNAKFKVQYIIMLHVVNAARNDSRACANSSDTVCASVAFAHLRATVSSSFSL